MPLGRLHRVRLTIGEVMVVIAALAVLCAWPMLFLSAAAAVVSLIFHRRGFTFVEQLVVMALMAVVIALYIPTVHTRCRRGRPRPVQLSPNPTPKQTQSAAPTIQGPP